MCCSDDACCWGKHRSQSYVAWVTCGPQHGGPCQWCGQAALRASVLWAVAMHVCHVIRRVRRVWSHGWLPLIEHVHESGRGCGVAC